ncbi:MAG: response regulator [Candidatus Methanoperedens sp.]|nr:response regulator [Candidatus Methanoperedens sp.]
MIPKRSSSILIVNSKPDISELFAEMLLMGDGEYIINIAKTGKECIKAMERNLPGLVLLDIELADTSGWELIEKIKSNWQEIPVIIVSSKPPSIEDIKRISLVSDYLMRPVTLDGLLMAVKDALELPELLDQCLGRVNKYMEQDGSMYSLFLLLKQNISDRKQYILFKQLYSNNDQDNGVETKLILDNLKVRITKARDNIEYFKNSRVLFA